MIIASAAVALALATPAVALTMPAVAPAGVQVAAKGQVASAISGRVVDSRTNAPLTGVKVTAFRQGFTVAEATAMTDNKGQFTLTGLDGGEYRLLFELAGYPRSLAAGIGVRPHDHLVLVSAFALQSKTRVEQARILDPCSSLLQPGQVADVYVICNGH
jgi:hypothetical protein